MNLDRNTLRKAALLIAGGILFHWLLGNFAIVGGALRTVWGLLFPFILGFIIAFILNLPMSAIEKHIFRGRGGRLKRPCSLLLSAAAVLGVLSFVVFMVIPELVDTVVSLANAMPGYIRDIQTALAPYADYVPELESWLSALNLDWPNLLAGLMNLVQSGLLSFFSSAFGLASSIVGGIVSLSVGIVFAVYLLADKEHLSAQLRGLLKAYLPARTCRRAAYVGALSYRTYSGFVAGQCAEALILTLLYILTLWIGGFDYWLLISVLTGFASLVPMIGAVFGCAVGTLLLLISMGFWRALAFVIVFLVVQNIEGNLIYPHVVGKSVGLPAVWILVAVMVGGGLAGVFGMLVFIPLFSILYTLLARAARARLVRRGIPSPVAVWRRRAGRAKKRGAGKGPAGKGGAPKQ